MDKKTDAVLSPPPIDAADAGPSAPPPWQAAPPQGEPVPYTEDPLDGVYIPPGGEEPPPEFTAYEAEYFEKGDGIISHDPHLNEDGEALYRFLLSQSTARPVYQIHLRGTHTEHRTRTRWERDSQGHSHARTEHYTETVTDFDFYIDLGQYIVQGPTHWSVPDEQAAYRGKMYMQVDAHDPGAVDEETGIVGRRKADKAEIRGAQHEKARRKALGLPPWVGPWEGGDGGAHPVVLKSSRTLRQWADEYCASDKLLKEFRYTKAVYGWNVENLKLAIEAAIRSVYTGSASVDFVLGGHKIRVRPDNRLARTLSNGWLVFLLWITLLFPFIWLYKRFGRRGGGRWEVCGGAYAFKAWVPVDPRTVPQPFPTDGRWAQTPDGPMRLVGLREGEFYQQWEYTIRAAVSRRVQSYAPIMRETMPMYPMNLEAMALPGYQPYANVAIQQNLPL